MSYFFSSPEKADRLKANNPATTESEDQQIKGQTEEEQRYITFSTPPPPPPPPPPPLPISSMFHVPSNVHDLMCSPISVIALELFKKSGCQILLYNVADARWIGFVTYFHSVRSNLC